MGMWVMNTRPFEYNTVIFHNHYWFLLHFPKFHWPIFSFVLSCTNYVWKKFLKKLISWWKMLTRNMSIWWTKFSHKFQKLWAREVHEISWKMRSFHFHSHWAIFISSSSLLVYLFIYFSKSHDSNTAEIYRKKRRIFQAMERYHKS